jgi:5-formyltetrahydrofolate cyclo-ligase
MEAFAVSRLEHELVAGNHRMLEPCERLEQLQPTDINLIVVPGVCFDYRGGRLGYGRGFYDTYFQRLRPDTLRMAIAFELQLLDNVPTEVHDLPVDVLVTEKRVVRFAPRAGGDEAVSH